MFPVSGIGKLLANIFHVLKEEIQTVASFSKCEEGYSVSDKTSDRYFKQEVLLARIEQNENYKGNSTRQFLKKKN